MPIVTVLGKYLKALAKVSKSPSSIFKNGLNISFDPFEETRPLQPSSSGLDKNV
jgi:hypothetical protein